MVMRRSGKDWLNNEREVMELLGLKQVPGSGSSWIAREDGQNDYILCQLKSTDKQSIRVQLQDIHELQVNAMTEHKTPVFAIQFRETNEVFLLVSPIDLQFAAEFLNDPRKPKAYVGLDGDLLDISNDWQPSKMIASSSNAREEFQKENDKKFKKKRKSAI